MNENTDLKINGIKDIVEIPDYSIFLFSFIIFLILVLFLVLIFYIIRYFKNKKPNKRKEYFSSLKSISFQDSKKDAYLITKYLRLLATNEREKNLSNEIIDDLEKYKYKKDVSQINDSIKNKLSTFMDIVDV